MSSKHDRTLAAIFTDPAPANLRWGDVMSLLRNLGATITEGAGSRTHVTLNGEESVFHRPHPGNELSRPAVRSVRRFLDDAGVEP